MVDHKYILISFISEKHSRVRCTQFEHGTVGWDSRIHKLHLCKRVRLPNECPEYDTKWSGGEALVMPELWGVSLYCHRSQVYSGPEW